MLSPVLSNMRHCIEVAHRDVVRAPEARHGVAHVVFDPMGLPERFGSFEVRVGHAWVTGGVRSGRSITDYGVCQHIAADVGGITTWRRRNPAVISTIDMSSWFAPLPADECDGCARRCTRVVVPVDIGMLVVPPNADSADAARRSPASSDRLRGALKSSCLHVRPGLERVAIDGAIGVFPDIPVLNTWNETKSDHNRKSRHYGLLYRSVAPLESITFAAFTTFAAAGRTTYTRRDRP